MNYQEKIKSIVLLSLITFSGFFIYFLALTIINYSNGVSEADALKEEVAIEMITITADDGAQINAYFMVSHDNMAKSDHSVPFVVACHGMSGGPLSHLEHLAYTLTLRGFAVLLPEYRGHESSDVPTTFGSKEPSDILSLINHIETEEKFNCVNITNSGVIGTSLGGLMGMSTYIFESLGRGRLKAIAIGAGPVNVTRAIELFTKTPDALGDNPFLGNLTGLEGDKNPINYINATFPSNVLIRHGTEDMTVDFNCSTDFLALLDPTGTRPDIEFHIKYGAGHEVAGNTETLKNAISWIENYTIHAYTGSHTNVTDVEIKNFAGFSTNNIKDFMHNFQVTCVLLIFIIPLSVYLIKPEYFKTKKDSEIESEIIEDDRNPPNKEEKIIILIGFGLIQVIALLISLFFVKDDILTELMIPAVLSMACVLYLYHYKFPKKTQEWCKQAFNPKVGSLFILSAIISMVIYHIIPNLPIIKQSMLFFGVRVTWFFPYLITLITISFMSNVFFVRYLLSGTDFRKTRLLEPLLNGLIMMISLMIFFSWNIDADLFGIPMALVIIIGVLIVFIVVDILGQIAESTLKTMVIVPILGTLIVALLLLSNYNIFYFF